MDNVDRNRRRRYRESVDETPVELQYLTIAEAADLLGISVAGVQKAIQRRQLPVLQFSPRRRRVTRLAVEAYRTRGERVRRVPVDDVEVMREEFREETGMSAREWQERWRRGEFEETFESYRLGSASMFILAIEAEEAESTERAGAMAAAPSSRPAGSRRVAVS